MKPFSKWTIEEVEEEFQIVIDRQNSSLREWMRVTSQPAPEEEQSLTTLGAKLQESVWDMAFMSWADIGILRFWKASPTPSTPV